jgi:pimeloyl-ACP methyl ester carboxylesterase
VLTQTDCELTDGRTLHVYQADAEPVDDRLAVVWHHGTPNVGEPPEPLRPAAARLGLRWVSYDRPGYGGSTPHPGRDLASAAADVEAIADALGLERFAVMGHSGGAGHALACAALLPDRVVAAVCGSGLAPAGAAGLDWFAGMIPSGAAELRAAAIGRTALQQQLAAGGYDPQMFTSRDHAALEGAWSWLAGVAGRAVEAGPAGMVDDDLAYLAPWGFVPEAVRVPVLFLHGEQDRIVPRAHGEWLAERVPGARLWLRPDDGHVSVLHSAEAALAWVAEQAEPA